MLVSTDSNKKTWWIICKFTCFFTSVRVEHTSIIFTSIKEYMSDGILLDYPRILYQWAMTYWEIYYKFPHLYSGKIGPPSRIHGSELEKPIFFYCHDGQSHEEEKYRQNWVCIIWRQLDLLPPCHPYLGHEAEAISFCWSGWGLKLKTKIRTFWVSMDTKFLDSNPDPDVAIQTLLGKIWTIFYHSPHDGGRVYAGERRSIQITETGVPT